MKHIKYILIALSLTMIGGFIAFTIIDIPIEQTDVEIKIQASHFTN